MYGHDLQRHYPGRWARWVVKRRSRGSVWSLPICPRLTPAGDSKWFAAPSPFLRTVVLSSAMVPAF